MHRSLRMVFPPPFPERTAGFFTIARYLADENVAGDIVECGVGRGVSFFLIGYFMSRLGVSGRLFGFDSFAGFPAPSQYDQSSRNPRLGEWGDTSPEHVRQHFVEAGLTDFFDTRCRLVPGFFEQTLTGTLEFSEVAFLHLDVDLYDSYRVSGNILEPLVTRRGLVLFDEYDQPSWPGATKAVREILTKSDRILFYSKLMKKHIAIDSRHWAGSSPAVVRLGADLQLEPSGLDGARRP